MDEMDGAITPREKLLERTIQDQKREIERLQRAVRELVSHDRPAPSSPSRESSPSFSSMTLSDRDSAADLGEDGTLPKAIWDQFDNVDRCVKCNYEVVEGVCQHCFVEHRYDSDEDEADDDWVTSKRQPPKRGDRVIAPRGTTPLLELGQIATPEEYSRRSDQYPYATRVDEYTYLIARGATALMCKTFNLEFTSESGIIAWADEAIFEDFAAGSEMEKGDNWKIHLGRRVVLDEDDFDGGQFMEEFLEEVLLFPNKLALDGEWETVLESPGIWVTRPRTEIVEPRDVDSDGFTDSDGDLDEQTTGTANIQNDYVLSDDEEEEEDVIFASGWSHPGNEADSDFESSRSEVDEEEVIVEMNGQAGRADGDGGDISSADSDFDSQEELSGDEMVLRRR